MVALPEGGWEVLLDDRSINTPKNNELRIPTEALAYAIAQVRIDASPPLMRSKGMGGAVDVP